MACAYRWHIGNTPPVHQAYIAVTPDGDVKHVEYVPDGYPAGAAGWESDAQRL